MADHIWLNKYGLPTPQAIFFEDSNRLVQTEEVISTLIGELNPLYYPHFIGFQASKNEEESRVRALRYYLLNQVIQTLERIRGQYYFPSPYPLALSIGAIADSAECLLKNEDAIRSLMLASWEVDSESNAPEPPIRFHKLRLKETLPISPTKDQINEEIKKDVWIEFAPRYLNPAELTKGELSDIPFYEFKLWLSEQIERFKRICLNHQALNLFQSGSLNISIAKILLPTNRSKETKARELSKDRKLIQKLSDPILLKAYHSLTSDPDNWKANKKIYKKDLMAMFKNQAHSSRGKGQDFTPPSKDTINNYFTPGGLKKVYLRSEQSK